MRLWPQRLETYSECISDDGDLLSSSLASILFDGNEDEMFAATIVLSRTDGGNVRRDQKQKWQNTCIVWHAHVVQLHHKYLFERTYRRLHTISLFLYTRNTLGVDPIPVQIVMATGLWWLAGCPCLDIHISKGISQPSVYCFRVILLVPVNLTAELNLVFPQTDAEIRKTSQDFRTQGKSGIMAQCVGCIDR